MLFEGKIKRAILKDKRNQIQKKQLFIRFPKMIFECNVFLLKTWKIRFKNPYQKYFNNSENPLFF